MVVLKVKGVDKLIRRLNKVGTRISKNAERGLLNAGHFIMTESLKIVPVQLGDLRGSWFVRKVSRHHIIIGYEGVEYAVYVHEIPNPPHAHGREFNIKHAAEIAAAVGTWLGTAEGGMFKRGEEQQYKYLEHPLRVNLREVVKIVRLEAKKGMR
jgi:hypothetical protein